jgi:hypothetical protein
MFVGLVRSSDWEPSPPPEPSERPRGRSWSVPWRALAWVALWWGLMAAVPLADHLLGGLAGYGVLLLAVTLGLWRLDRWCSRQYWHGLREYQA